MDFDGLRRHRGKSLGDGHHGAEQHLVAWRLSDKYRERYVSQIGRLGDAYDLKFIWNRLSVVERGGESDCPTSEIFALYQHNGGVTFGKPIEIIQGVN